MARPAGLRRTEARAPRGLGGAPERQGWASGALNEAIAARLEALHARLDAGDALDAAFRDGELTLFAGGSPLIGRIYYEDEALGKLSAAYWRWLALSQAWRDAGRLAVELRCPPMGPETPAAGQFVAKVEALAGVDLAIAAAEQAMNDRLFGLYAITEEERLLINNAGGARAGATNRS
ncbi:MAG: hypothetical protein ACR2F8_06465 [Caulobacteraceae bacterium]